MMDQYASSAPLNLLYGPDGAWASVPSHLSGPHNTRSLRNRPNGTERRDRVAACKVPRSEVRHDDGNPLAFVFP